MNYFLVEIRETAFKSFTRLVQAKNSKEADIAVMRWLERNNMPHISFEVQPTILYYNVLDGIY